MPYTSAIELPTIRRNENIGLEGDGAADVYGMHAARDIGYQAGNRVGRDFEREVANHCILNVGITPEMAARTLSARSLRLSLPSQKIHRVEDLVQEVLVKDLRFHAAPKKPRSL